MKNINDLTDSLNKMSVPEIIDDFKCSNCNQKVTIEKKIFLNKLPNVLVVHLKRFYLNYEIFKTMKINSKFVFPKNLNLKQYCITENQKNSENKNDNIYPHDEEYYEYELKGINVHTGSADGGHYFSFIDVNRDGKNNLINNYKKENWLIFNDSKVLEFDTDTIPTECYGGNYEGSSYENCQNAYLLIYERKKKLPIRVIYKKDELGDIEKNNLININKDNRSELNKKYDLSRLKNADVTEDELYKKIFFDEEKEEYYKYIPFYNVPKYAPTKVYNEIMEENNTKEESQESNNNNSNANKEKYEEILTNLIKTSKLDINNSYYDDKMRRILIESIMDDLLKSIQLTQTKFDEEEIEEFNKTLEIIFNKLLKPLIKKDTSDSLLNTICKYLCNEIFMKFIFTSKYDNKNEFLDKITNESNTLIIKDILYELVKIFSEKNEESMKNKIYSIIFKTIFNSNGVTSSFNFEMKNPNYKYTVIHLYQLLDDLIHLNEDIMEYISENKYLAKLCLRLIPENEEIRIKICQIVKYLLKNSSDYPKELNAIYENNDIQESIKNGDKYIYYQKDDIQSFSLIDTNMQLIVYYDLELFIIFAAMAIKDDMKYLREFFYISAKQIYDFVSENKSEIKIDYIINLLFALAITKDVNSLEKYKHILGYPNPIINEIPRENEDDDEPPSPTSPSSTQTQKQNFPIFGEKLIDGNLDKQIYEFVNINRRRKSFCLLKLLLPNENEENNVLDIPKEMAVKYIIKLIENCLGENNNYSLFKYLYLNPSRCLRYENLYQEMKEIILNENKEFNFEPYLDKERKFIAQIQKEVEKSLKDLKEEGMEISDEDEVEDDIAPPLNGENYYECEDKNMKKFIGFISNIIPGDIIREEIVQIAKGDTIVMYRLEYYAKYYNAKEFREKLLNKEKNNDQDDVKEEGELNNEEKENINKEDEKKEEEKEEEIKPEEEKKEEKPEEENKEGENKSEQNEEENKDNEKQEENKPNEEDKLNKEDKPNEENKEENTHKEDNKEEDKPNEEKKEEQKNEEEKNEEQKKEEDKPNEEKKEEEEEEKKEEDKPNEEKKEEEEEKKEEDKPNEDKKEEEKKEEDKPNEYKKEEEEKKEEDKPNEENKEEEKNSYEKPNEEKKEEKSEDKEKEKEENYKEQEKNEEDKKETKEENEEKEPNKEPQENAKEEEDHPDPNEESKNPEENSQENQQSEKKDEEEKKPEDILQKEPEPQPESNIPIETEIDDSLEKQELKNDKIVKKYNISTSQSEVNYIYDKLPYGQSTVILDNDYIKDKNKVKRVLFRYILTNTNYDARSFKSVISTKESLTGIKKYNSSVIPEFIFGRIKRQDMSNFYNVYRIREELPFMERDNIKINIAMGDDINFKK